MKTRDQIITDAFRKIGGLGDNEVATPEQIAAGASALHSLVLALAHMGMPTWKMTRVQVPLNLFTTMNPVVTIGPGQQVSTPTMPLKVHTATRNDGTSNVPIFILGREHFFRLPVTTASGAPVNCYYKPEKTHGLLQIWPATPDPYWTNHVLLLDIQCEFTTPANDTDTPDFPDYFEEAIIYNLAVRLAPEYGLAPTDRQMLTADAKEILKNAIDFDYDVGSLFLRPTPDWSNKYGVY